MKQADRVASAADARECRIRQPALLEQLRARLAADHGLQVAHEERIRVRTDREPSCNSTDGIRPSCESRRRSPHAACDLRISRRRPSRRSADPIDVRRLARDVDLAHVHRARQADACARGP
jgi:hypothetical protein